MNLVRIIRFSIIKFERFCKRSKTQNQIHKDGTNGNTGDGTTPNGSEAVTLIRDAIFFGGGTLFAGLFFGTDHKILGLLASFIGLLAAFHIPFHYWAKQRGQKFKAWFWYVVLMLSIAVWFFVWSYKIAHPEEKPAAPNAYKLLPSDVVSNMVQTLKDPSGHVHPAAILICLANPDDSAVAFSEQLKKIFWDGGYLIVSGAPPSEIPEKPRVSCFVYGNVISNLGIWRALTAILDATKSNSSPEVIPIYPNRLHVLWPPLSSLPSSASPTELKSAEEFKMMVIAMTHAEFSPISTSGPPPMADSEEVMRRVAEDGNSWTNSIVVIMIRSK